MLCDPVHSGYARLIQSQRAEASEGVGQEKYDETSAGIIALLKYGTGLPFHRLENLREESGYSARGFDAVGDHGRPIQELDPDL
jgi:hypothetical protein